MIAMLIRMLLLLVVLCAPVVASQDADPDTHDAEELVLAAERGDGDAQHQLGRAYQQGDGVPQDDADAVRWYRVAAEQGHVQAQNDLGNAYANGSGVSQDANEAVRWRVAADEPALVSPHSCGCDGWFQSGISGSRRR